MADLVLNRGKGRFVELAERVNANDPANSVIIVTPIESSGVESDAVLRDKDSLSDLVSGTTNEATTGGWNRKSLDNAAGITVTYDDTNDRVDVDIPDQTWTGVSGNASSDVVCCYDNDSTAGTDANIIVVSLHDFPITPDGSDVTAQIAAAGIWRAS